MKKIINNILMLFAFTVLFTSCESTDLELQVNPQSLSPESANPDFILNGMLIGAASQHIGLSFLTAPVVRQVNQFGTYTNNIQGLTDTSMNGAWALNYQLMTNLNLLKDLSTAANLPHHVGVAQILNAFEMVNLVDYLGIAVFSEAVNPDLFPAPGLDSGESIYAEMILLLEEGIANLHQTAAYTHNDSYYDGDLTKWEKLANSLIIRMYVQSRKAGSFNATEAANKINTIVSSGMYISNNDDDFQVQFGTNEINPDVRHPFFQQNYLGAPSVYMSNYFMDKLLFDKSVEDPRLKHYIYRQTLDAPTGGFINDCLSGNQGSSICYVGNGYWGRIHADETGIPNDNLLRATYGAYPAGGAFDNNEGVSIHNVSNMGGAGIHPMITNMLMNFLLAEASLFIPGVNGNTSTYLDQAMQASFDKVSAFTGKSMSDVNTYKSEVLSNFNGTTNLETKLEIIITENHLAMFGNGLEPYNAYRRTGYPNFNASFQNSGSFPRSMFMPKSELETNDNPDIVQKLLTDQVFWDTNSAGFID